MPTPPKPRSPAQRARNARNTKNWRDRQSRGELRERDRRANLWRRYKITPEDFDALLLSQGNSCAICQSKSPRHRLGWRVDHNHMTGKVRGILCNHCNVVLGMTHEDPVTLLQIAVYLRSHE